MALRFVYTNPITGEVSPKAHLILDDPIIRGDVQHVVVRGRVYASKEDFDAGKASIAATDQEYGKDEYDALREVNMELCEGWVLRDFPDVKPLPPGQGQPQETTNQPDVVRVAD